MDKCVLRISRPYEEVREVFEGLGAESIIVYEHDEASRVHIHALLKGCSIQLLSLKRRIEKVVGKVSKTDWSFKTTEITDQFITYMSKGKLEPVFVKGFTPEQIASYRSAWIERVKVQTKLTKVNDKATYKEILCEVKKLIPKDSGFYFCNYDDAMYVARNLNRILTEKDIITSRYKVRDMLDTLFRDLDNETFSSKVVNSWRKDFI